MSADLEIIEIKKLSTIERLRFYLENPKKNGEIVTQRDLDYLDKLKSVFALHSEEFTKSGLINRIMLLADVTTVIQAKNLIEASNDLFGASLELNKEIELAFLYQHYSNILQSLTFEIDELGRKQRRSSVEDSLAQAEILDKMAKLIKQLPDQKEKMPPPAKSFIFTAEPKALKGHG